MDLLRSLMSVLEAINQGIHVVDHKGVTVVYNRAASQLDGLSESEVMGKRLLDVFPSLDHDSSTLLRVLRTGVPETAKQQIFTNYKGKKITTVNSTTPITDGGKIVGACEISTDVTRMKEMAERIVDLQRELFDKDGRKSAPSFRRQSNFGERRLYSLDDIIGESAAMKSIKATALKVAASDAGIVVWGETGTGKELLVQSIHSASPRRRGPFVPQNSAALPESLLEGLVFGTVRGGFTGSLDRPGLLELASGGSLYLDEVDSMPLGLQAKLLRVIQDKRVRRLGDSRERPVDVRIIASTESKPADAVSRGLLRPDLYYRLSVVEIGIPPLRERRADIPLLCDYFLTKYAGSPGTWLVSPQVMASFLSYEWPGNVRELEHAIQGSLALARGPVIGVDDLSGAVPGILATASLYSCKKPADRNPGSESLPTGQDGVSESPGRMPEERFEDELAGRADGADEAITSHCLRDILRERERDAILGALARGGSVSGAARILGIPRQTLQYRMRVLGIRGTTLA